MPETATTSIALGDGINLRGTIDGGAGIDTIDYAASTTAIRANLGLGTTGLSATLGGDQENPADHARRHRHRDGHQLQHHHAHVRHHRDRVGPAAC